MKHTYTMAEQWLIIVATTLLAVALVAADARDVVLAPLGGTGTGAVTAASFVVNGVIGGAQKLTDADLNARTCDHVGKTVTFKKVCYGLMKMPGVTTPRSFLEAALRVSLGKAKVAKAKFDEAMRGPHEGNPVASILETCDGGYDELVTALEEAQQVMDVHGSGADLLSKMSAAGTFATDCDNWFQERKISSPHAAMQRQVARVVTITLDIAAQTKQI